MKATFELTQKPVDNFLNLKTNRLNKAKQSDLNDINDDQHADNHALVCNYNDHE